MRKIIYLAFVLIAVSSCKKETGCIRGNGDFVKEKRNTDVFDEVKVDGSLNVFITQDSITSIEVSVESNLKDRLRTDVIDGKLSIHMEGCISRMRETNIYLHTPNLNSVSLNGSGNISTSNRFNTSSFTSELNGSGKLDLNVDTKDANTSLNGSGDIILRGSTITTSMKLSGSGKIDGEKFLSKTANVSVSGSGDVYVAVSDSLSATISGSGKIYYFGNPVVNQNVSGSGKVIHK